MNKICSPLVGALLTALVLGFAGLAVAAGGGGGHKPSVTTTAAIDVTDRSATLMAVVRPEGSTTSYRFEYGPTTGYGQSTAAGTIDSGGGGGGGGGGGESRLAAEPVSAVISSLSPMTVYHFRVRATNDEGTGLGGDQSFTTAPADPSPVDIPSVGDDGTIPPSIEAPAPRLGTSILIAPTEGTVRVKRPGAAGYITMTAGDSVPVGSVIDTRQGTVNLTSSVGGDKTQSGEFRGALFSVRQSRKGHGMTDLVLRGGNIAACSRTATRVTSRAKKKKKKKRSLFGKDKGGKFKTHGHDSVATVRGTAWVTTDTCAGTRTTVTEGSVSVRDRRRGKTVVVRAGHSYLARSRR